MSEGSDSVSETIFMPFILRALGFLDNEPSSTSLPRTLNIARLRNRNYSIILSAPATLHSLSTVHERFHNVLELRDVEAVSHFIRIYSGDFPWIKLNSLIGDGNEAGEISEIELDIWDEYVATYQDQDSFFEMIKDVPADCAREAVNDVVLWAIAGDFRWGFEEVDDILKKIGKKNLTLGYFHDQLLYEVEVVMDDEVLGGRTRCSECGSICVANRENREDVESFEDIEDVVGVEDDEIDADVEDVVAVVE